MKLDFNNSISEVREIAYIVPTKGFTLCAIIQSRKGSGLFQTTIEDMDGLCTFFRGSCETKEEAYTLLESKVDELIEKFFLELSQCENIRENYKVEKL